MASTKLTQLAIDKLKPPETGRIELHDKVLPGFGLRLGPGGGVWFILYRHDGKQRRFTIGPLAEIDKLEEARARARKLFDDLGRGIDPAAARDVPPPAPAPEPLTVRGLVEEFITRYAKPKNRSWKTTERNLQLHVVPTWGERRADGITRADGLKLFDELRTKMGPGSNRVLAAAKKCFAWAAENDLIPVNPLTSLRQRRELETVRERVLSDAEMRMVWRAADAVGGVTSGYIKLLVLLGQRRGEIAGLRWADIDADYKLLQRGGSTVDCPLIRLPGSRTKNKRGHTIPLPAHVCELLDAIPRAEDASYIFTTRGDAAISGFSKLKSALDAKIAELARKDAEETGAKPMALAAWNLHDLRRTAASGMDRLGVPESVISDLLNHSAKGITRGVYIQRDRIEEKLAALTAWADHVAKTVARNDEVTS